MHIVNKELIPRVYKEHLQINKKYTEPSNMIPKLKVTVTGPQNCKCQKLIFDQAVSYSSTFTLQHMKLNLLEADKCPHQSEVDRSL